MNIRDQIRVEHISDAISEIESYTQGVSKEEYLSNSMLQSATIRQLEVIGEAARALSNEFKFKFPSIPWREWADFRNVLIHQYFGVDDEEVYQVLKEELPELKTEVAKILQNSVKGKEEDNA